MNGGWESRQRIALVEADGTVDGIVRHVAGDLGLTSQGPRLAPCEQRGWDV